MSCVQECFNALSSMDDYSKIVLCPYDGSVHDVHEYMVSHASFTASKINIADPFVRDHNTAAKVMFHADA